MENHGRPPWGGQDALRIRRGLLRAITPNYLVAGSEDSCPPAQRHYTRGSLQHRPDSQQQHRSQSQNVQHQLLKSSDISCHPVQQEQRQHELLTSPQQLGEDQHLCEGPQQQTHRQYHLQQKLCKLPENSIFHSLRRGSDCVSVRRRDVEHRSATFSRPHATGKHSPTAAATAVAGDVCVTDRFTPNTGSLIAQPFKPTELQRSCSSSSIRCVQQWPLQLQEAQHGKPQPQEWMEQKHPHRQLQLLTQAHPSSHSHQGQTHYLQRQQEQSLQPQAQYCPQAHEARQSTRVATLRKPFSDVTKSNFSLKVRSKAQSLVLRGPSHTELNGETDRQEQGASASMCGTPSVTRVDAERDLPRPDDCARPAVDPTSKPAARLKDILNVPDPVTAAAHPVSAAVTPAAAAKQAGSGATTTNATSPAATTSLKGEAALQHVSSRKVPSGESHFRVKQQRDNSPPLDGGSRHYPHQPVDTAAHATTAPATVPQRQAVMTVRPNLAPEPATMCGPDLQCSWLQSRTYAAFSEIATHLIHQVQHLSRTVTATHVFYPTPSCFGAAVFSRKARSLLCTGTRGAIHVGARSWVSTSAGSHTAHCLSTVYGLPAHASRTDYFDPDAPACTTAENQPQGAAPLSVHITANRKDAESAVSTAIGQDYSSPHTLEQLKRDPQQPQPLLTQQQQQQFYRQRCPLQSLNEDSTAFPVNACTQGEQQKNSYPNDVVESSSSQPLTACCSDSAGASAAPRFTSSSQVTNGVCTLGDASESHLGSTAISPVDCRSSTAHGAFDNDVPLAAPVASVRSRGDVDTGASGHHGCVPVPASSAPGLSTTAAACTPSAFSASSAAFQSNSRLKATDAAHALAGAAGAPTRDGASFPRATSLSGSSAVDVAATGSHPAPACAAVPNTAADQVSSPALHAAPESDCVSTVKRTLAARAPHLTLLPQQVGNGCPGIYFRTCLDISSYSLDSEHFEAIRDTKMAAVAPGPLVRLFAFYSRVFLCIRKGHICREVSGTQEESCPQSKTLEVITTSATDSDSSNSATRNGGSKCSRGKQADSGTNESGSCGEGGCAGSRNGSRSNSTRSVVVNSINGHNSSRSCENRNRNNSRVEHSSTRPCSCCGRRRRYSSTSKELPLHASLSRLLHDPVSFTEPCFGLFEAQQMVEDFSRHLKPFSLSPRLVEELWVLVLLATSMTPAAATGNNPPSANVCVTAAPSEVAQTPYASSPLLPLSRACPDNAFPLPVLPVNNADRMMAPAASVSAASRGGSAVGYSSPIVTENRTGAASTCSSVAVRAERIPRPATSGAHTTPSHKLIYNFSSTTSAESCTRGIGPLFSSSRRQLHEKRVNFLGFTTFLAAAVTLATKHASTAELLSQPETTSRYASSAPTGSEPHMPPVSAAASGTCLPATAAVEEAPVVASKSVSQQSAAISATVNCICEPAAVAATQCRPRVACAGVQQTCPMFGNSECYPTGRRTAFSELQCVQQFMQRIGTVRAVNRFLLEAYKDLHTYARAAADKEQKSDRLWTRAPNSAASSMVDGRIGAAATAASTQSAAGPAAPSTANALRSATTAKNAGTALVAKPQGNAYVDLDEAPRSATRRKTDVIRRHTSRLNDLVGCLPKRCNSDAPVQLKGAVYKQNLTTSTTPWNSTALELQTNPHSPKRSVLFRKSADSACNTGSAGSRASLPHPATLSRPCRQQQNPRSNVTAPPIKQHLCSVLPGRKTLQWLLQRYTFSAVAPIWLPYAALFIDMGVQRALPKQQRPQEAKQSAFEPILRQRARTTQLLEKEGNHLITQQQGMRADPGQHDAANKELHVPAKTHPKEHTSQNLLIDQTVTINGGCLYRASANEEQLPPHVAQDRCAAVAVAAKSPLASESGAPASGSEDITVEAAEAVGAVPSKADLSVRDDAAAAGASFVKTPAAQGAVAAQACHGGDVTFVVPLEAAPAADRYIRGAVLASAATGIPVNAGDARVAACSDNCVSALGSSQAAYTCGDPLAIPAAAAAGTCVAPHEAARAAAPAPLQVDNNAQQERPSSAGDMGAAEKPPAEETPAADVAQTSLKELPLPEWQVVQQRAAQQRQRLQEHAAVLQAQAKRKARRHRFAIEAENQTTKPVLLIVDLENLPPVVTSQCSTPLLLVPGCCIRITLDVDRTHEPGEWLGFAHVRLRSRGSSSTSTGDSGQSRCASCSGEYGRNRRRDRGNNRSSKRYTSKNNDIRGRSGSCSPSKGAQLKPSNTGNTGPNGMNSFKGKEYHSSSTSYNRAGSDSHVFFSEKVVSIPIYLRLSRDEEHPAAVNASAAPPQAATESRSPVVMSTATATAPAGASASLAGTGTIVSAQEDPVELQKVRKQSRARPLSPLPLHADRASIAAVLGCTSRRCHKIQPPSPSAFCCVALTCGVSECQKERQQSQGQQPLPQRQKASQSHMLRSAAREKATVPSTTGAARCSGTCLSAELQQSMCVSSDHIHSGCTSRIEVDGGQSSRCLTGSTVRPATDCAQLTTSCNNDSSSSDSTKCPRSDVCISAPGSSSEMPSREPRTDKVPRSIERSRGSDSITHGKRDVGSYSGNTSKESTSENNTGVNIKSSRDNGGSSGEGGRSVQTSTVSADTSQTITQEVCSSPSLSVTSSSSVDTEVDWYPESASATISASSGRLSTGQRLNAREYSFLHRAETLERLQEAVPDCFYLGQQLLHQQYRLLQQHRQQYHANGSQQHQDKQQKHQQRPDADQRPQECQPSESQRPRHRHIRWLRGHLLYGKHPMERKGWATPEAAAAVQQRQQRKKASAVAQKTVQRAEAKETTTTLSSAVDETEEDYFLDGKLPCTNSLFYYDSSNANAFRCSGCGVSFWGKFKRENEDDPLSALRNLREEEMREASTASCSTSVALPWSLQQHSH